MDFSTLVTDDINEHFCHVQYDKLNLIMMKENGFINATKLCRLGNKHFKDWLKLEKSKELIKEVGHSCKTISSYTDLKGLFMKIKNEHNEKYRCDVEGTYVHPDLIPHIISWIFPYFAIKISKIVNNYVSSKYEIRMKEKEIELKKIHKTLLEFNLKYDIEALEIKEQNKLMKERYISDTNELKVRLTELKEQNKELKIELQKIEQMIKDKAVNHYYPVNRFRHLMIFQNKKDLKSFKVLLIHRERINKELNKMKNDYRVFFSAYEPNAISCFNSLKDRLLKSKNIEFSYNDVMLLDTDIYGIKDFAEDLRSMDLVRKYA
ncbi:N1R/p28-like protein [Fowlpox virus]|nr:N1R/p28-like protein [Fowlpox virus]